MVKKMMRERGKEGERLKRIVWGVSSSGGGSGSG